MQTLVRENNCISQEVEAQTRGRQGRMLPAQERERAEALGRLLDLLERGNVDPRTQFRQAVEPENDSIHTLARLRSAHAAYVLRTNPRVQRVSDGAFVMERGNE